MAVLIWRSGKEGTPDILEEAVCWSMGPLTIKLFADEARTSLLCEFRLGEVIRLEYPETMLQKYIFPKKEKDEGEEEV